MEKISKLKKSLKFNAVISSFRTILTIIFPLITYPYAARVLQVTNLGKVDYSNSIVNYFVLFAGLGISTYAIREGARLRDNRKKLNEFCSQIFSINILSSIIAFITLILCLIFVPQFRNYTVLMLVQSLTIFGNLIGVAWIYSIEEDYLYITIRSIFVNLIALVLLLTLVHNKNDYVLYAMTSVIANAGANVFNYFHSKKYVDIKITLKMDLEKHWKPIMILFVSALTATIYVNSDKTLLGMINGVHTVGLYSMSVNVYTIVKSTFSGAILVTLPRVTNYLGNKQAKEYKRLASISLNFILFILIPSVVGLIISSKDIVCILGGRNYIESTVSLQILSLSLFFSILAIYITNVILLPNGLEYVNMKASLYSALINIFLNIFILPLFKQNGAAFTTLCAEFFIFFYQYWNSRKLEVFKLNLDQCKSITTASLSFVLVGLLIDFKISNVFINLLLKILICVAIYCFILLLFKNEIIVELKNNFFNILNRKLFRRV